MSRTYRKVPHWASKKHLRHDFDEGTGHWGFHNRLKNFTNADDYVKAATAYFRGERGTGWQGMKDRVGPNGNVIGYEDDAGRCPAARTRTNKIRRMHGKKEISAAISEMVEDAQNAFEEMMDLEIDLRDDFDESHWSNWDDYLELDLDLEGDYYEDYYHDPFWDMDYDYMR